jgi:aspartate carbamoyltransferase catalytic subunit
MDHMVLVFCEYSTRQAKAFDVAHLRIVLNEIEERR